MPDSNAQFNIDTDTQVTNQEIEDSITPEIIGDLLKRAANMVNELNAILKNTNAELTSVQVDGNTSIPQFRYKEYLTGMRLQNLDEVVLMGNSQDIIFFKRASSVEGRMRADMTYGFTPGNANGTLDIAFSRGGANTLLLGNGTFGNRSGKLKLGRINMTQYTPTSTADAAGEDGDMCYDNNYIYQKVAGVGWVRIGTWQTF